jgi:magnesium chelatase family protein
MVSLTKTFSYIGIEAIAINVEVKISAGNPSFTIVGLPDKALGESKERVRAAIMSTGLSWPYQRITVNLAPADFLKEGSHFDLAIAIGIMIEIGVLPQHLVDNFFMIGELSLGGNLCSVSGALSAAIGANQYNCGLICPIANGKEATWASENLNIIASPNLIAIINHLTGTQLLSKPEVNLSMLKPLIEYPDIKDVKGQERAKRCLEIAAAGGHNLMFTGPAGSGKTMLAKRLLGILPDLELQEILEINMLASVIGNYSGELINIRPFREVHHSCSVPAMVGGGAKAKPGEISLANNGVLFLDELAEFPRTVIDALRQPLEDGKISIARANAHVSYPARFQFISAMNPCSCGHLGNPEKECKKAPQCGIEYQKRITEPVFDRIDIFVTVENVNLFDKKKTKEESDKNNDKQKDQLQNQEKNTSETEEEEEKEEENLVENSTIIKQRVIQAREIQKNRYKNQPEMKNISKINCNIKDKLVDKFCILDNLAEEILIDNMQRKNFSMRSLSRILKVSRTIADLEGTEKILAHHLSEALMYRRK